MKRIVLIVALAVMAIVSTSCYTNNAPQLWYGERTPVGDREWTVEPEWADQPSRMKEFDVPVSPLLGVVRLNLFIPEERLQSPLLAAVPLAGICPSCRVEGLGDHRTWESQGDGFRSRVAIELDFMTGIGTAFFNESCIEAYFLWGFSQRICRPPHGVTADFLADNMNGFRSVVAHPPAGGFEVYVLLSAPNAFSGIAPAPLNCTIDVGFRVWTDQGNVLAAPWAPFNLPVDEYPSLEGYWWDGLGGPARMIVQRPRTDAGPDALCAHSYQ